MGTRPLRVVAGTLSRCALAGCASAGCASAGLASEQRAAIL